ncbi:hypothetical protein HFN76_34710 [Rhizobium laguerreae]|uniref:hypothetical protein n=1 Tax=Rhizobium laguerreae TaxID=1076926 RepID=UPI001C913C03|nr:hypothetical protein [Rhizobium laguerreae]MBY3517262.1 hypothetical protein [Rhizobium laguerreae]
MTDDSVIFIGLDTSKLKISVAIADESRNGNDLPLNFHPAAVRASAGLTLPPSFIQF